MNDTQNASNNVTLNDTIKKWERLCPQCNKVLYHTTKRNRNKLDKLKVVCRECRSRLKKYDGYITEWFRKCPKCGRTIYHTSKNNLDRMINKNSLCIKCISESRIPPRRVFLKKVYKRICLLCGKETIYKNWGTFDQAEKQNRMCFKCSIKTRPPCSESTKNKISKANKGENNGFYGKTHSLEYKRRLSEQLKKTPMVLSKEDRLKISISLRKNAIKKMKDIGISAPRVNMRGCDFMDKYGTQHGYNFQHGRNGGEFYINELGIWVDGYDKDKNIVFEYDEKQHYTYDWKLRDKDMRRMNQIKKILNCKFIRYNEKLNEIKEY